MFVSKAKYQAMVEKFEHAADIAIELDRLLDAEKADHMHSLRLAKRALDRMEAAKTKQFTPAEVTRLIILCHPDRHGGKQMAVELTAKLLKLKRNK